MNINRAIKSLLIFFAFHNLSTAQSVDEFKTSAATAKQLVVENVYRYETMGYVQDTKISIDTRPWNEKSINPEDCLIKLAKAFREKNYSRMQSVWTGDSLRMMQAIDKKAGIESENRFMQVAERYHGDAIYFHTKVVFEKYVLIEFSIQKSTTLILRDTMALVQVQGEWKLTQELAGNPIVANWNAPAGRVRIPVTRNFLEITGIK